MDEMNTTSFLEALKEGLGTLIGGNQKVLLFLFLVVCLIQFLLVFLLYKENKESHSKINDLETLLEVTADRVLSIRERTDSVTYQEIVSRLQAGERPSDISKTVNVSLNELEALRRIIKTVS